MIKTKLGEYLAPEIEVVQMESISVICFSGGDGNEIMGSGSNLGNDDFV